jgi:integrase
MSKKGTITTANFIEYDKALNTGIKLMESKKNINFGFYIIVAINTGLRIGDILRLTKEDFENKSKKFREQKTGKAKEVLLSHPTILKAFERLNLKGSKVFLSQKCSIYTPQQINRKLKVVFKSKDKNISSHSLRKSFGRRVYEKNGETEKALVTLSKIYNHSSIGITRTYLDITKEEIENVYLNL